MRVVCVYREGEDYSRSVYEWLENVRRQTGQEVEVMDPDREARFCEAYGIVEYPTIVALDSSGMLRAMWKGRELPLINEVAYYLM